MGATKLIRPCFSSAVITRRLMPTTPEKHKLETDRQDRPRYQHECLGRYRGFGYWIENCSNTLVKGQVHLYGSAFLQIAVGCCHIVRRDLH
jgi:hypothetical protein